MRSDYQLKHQLFGRQGSLWERQVDDNTRTQVRGIVRAAGNAPVLTQLDRIAAGAANGGDVLMEDAYFRFSDGGFAVIGQLQEDYANYQVELDDGTRLQVAYRGDSTTYSTDPLPNRIARVADDFLNYIASDSYAFPTDRDWYLVPTPANISPIVIEGRDGAYLVQGIDFVARRGYIAMTDSPADVLVPGLVRVPSAQAEVFRPNAFTLSAPGSWGGKWLAEYAYKAQSLEAFKRAAAEYAGLFVFDEADVVLTATQVDTSTWVYTTAAHGAIVIDYPHVTLVRNQQVSPGDIISENFDVVASRYGEAANLKEAAATGWTDPVSLDGILPVNGLAWIPDTPVLADSVATDPDTGTPHLRLHFETQEEGDSEVLERYWEFSRLHEAETGVFLYDALGVTSEPFMVDLWELLEDFYGIQLVLVLARPHRAQIDTRLKRFIQEYHPASCVVMSSVLTELPIGGAKKDDYGNYLVDEYGEYVPDSVDVCTRYNLTINGNVLAHTSRSLTLEVCGGDDVDVDEDAVIFDEDYVYLDVDQVIYTEA